MVFLKDFFLKSYFLKKRKSTDIKKAYKITQQAELIIVFFAKYQFKQ